MLNSIKVAKLREKMKALDLDGFLVTSKENRQYLTGFTGTFGWVLVTHRDVYLMTDFRYVEQAQQQAPCIVFIDEIDKIAGKGNQHGADVSREGVQRDILPIVEGSTVVTKYGPIKTDFILFIAAGAFHVSSIEDLIPELQGRFPIKVELSSLSKEDFVFRNKFPQKQR